MPTPTAMLIQGNYRSFRVNMSNKYIGEGDENIYQVHDLVQSFGFHHSRIYGHGHSISSCPVIHLNTIDLTSLKAFHTCVSS